MVLVLILLVEFIAFIWQVCDWERKSYLRDKKSGTLSGSEQEPTHVNRNSCGNGVRIARVFRLLHCIIIKAKDKSHIQRRWKWGQKGPPPTPTVLKQKNEKSYGCFDLVLSLCSWDERMLFAVIDAKKNHSLCMLSLENIICNIMERKTTTVSYTTINVTAQRAWEGESLNNLPKYPSIIIKYKTKFSSNTLSMVWTILATCTHASKVLIHLHLHCCEWLKNSFIAVSQNIFANINGARWMKMAWEVCSHIFLAWWIVPRWT